MEKAFNILAMDKNFNIISLLRFSNLQWSRKYFESGSFSLQIPVSQYDSNMAYIYTKSRPELGRIEQVNYYSKAGIQYIQLSGYFLENDLNRMVCYPRSADSNITNITSSPSWITSKGKAEDVAFAYFNGFSKITFKEGNTTRTSSIGIDAGTNQHRGSQAEHTREGEYLGDKIFQILKPSGMSCRVEYDYNTSKKKFYCWQGLDRTEDNSDGNNPIIFSTRYGNVKDPNIIIDEISYKNCNIVGCEASATSTMSDGTVTISDSKILYLRAVHQNSVSNVGMDRFHYMNSSQNKDDYTSESAFISALDADGINEINNNYPRTINLEFDAMVGSYEYMVDFDLGDLCSVNIAEMGLDADVRLIGCYEVMKDGEWTMTLEFGTPIIKKR